MATTALFFDIFGRDRGVGDMLDKVGDKAKNTDGKLRGVSGGLNSMAAPAAGALAAIGGIAIGFGQMAADAEQSVGAVENVFGRAGNQVLEFSKKSATAVGLSGNEYNQLSAIVGTALKAAGVSVDQLAAKNDQLIQRGADMASVFGGTTADAVRAMGSAFRGEFDPLERYGVTLTMAQVKAELAARGQDKLGGAAAEAAKKQAIMDLIMKQSANSAGNFAKESDTASGSQQRATASFQDAAAKLGTALLPAMTKFAEIATQVAAWVEKNSELITILVTVLGTLAAGIVAARIAMTLFNIVAAANPIGAVILAVTALIGVIVLLSANWDRITRFLQDRWNGFTRWWGDGMNKMGGQWNSFWGGVGRNVTNIWNGTLGPAFDTIKRMVTQTVPNAFRDGVKWVAVHWGKLTEIAKAPVRFLVNTVINDGLIGTFNTVAGWVGIGKLGRVGLPAGFAGGGYTGDGGKYEPKGVVHGGEFVFTKEETAKAGVGTFKRLAQALRGYAGGGFVNPVPGAPISQGYHAGHNGIDFAAAMGTPIRAAFNGFVSSAGWSAFGGGNEIHIQHPDGYSTWYAHLSRFLVKYGQAVNRGQQIGLVGSSGNSTGPHLHYMLLRGGWPNHMNPAPFLGAGADIPAGGLPFNPIAPIVDGLIGALRGVFSGGMLAGELAVGFGKKILGDVGAMVVKSLGIGGVGGPHVFDDGGWLQSVGVNRSGAPEAVFSQNQWRILEGNLNKPMQVYVQNPFTGQYMLAKVAEVVDSSIGRSVEDLSYRRPGE